MSSSTDNYLSLLCDVGDVIAALTRSAGIDAFLQQIVELVARHLRAGVCSIYLYEDEDERLVLRATRGLNADYVGRISLKIGEGLVGHCLETLKPICEASASTNPRFRYFSELNEDRYDSFLAVPIYRGAEHIGVLVCQREEKDFFGDHDVLALRAIASQLASALEATKTLMAVDAGGSGQRVALPGLLVCTVASKGWALGPAIAQQGGGITPAVAAGAGSQYTLADFDAALQHTITQLEHFQKALRERMSEAGSMIFAAHLLMLKDPEFTGKMAERIRNGEAPVRAIGAVAEYYAKVFAASPNVYIQEKASDVADLASRIIANLTGAVDLPGANLAGKIVIARELFPSEMLKLSAQDVSGIILVTGGVTSHVSILARSLQIPMVIAERTDLLRIPPETPILLDALVGRVYVSPDQKVIDQYHSREHTGRIADAEAASITERTFTRDGTRIRLMANINLLSELELARKLKLEGVGLYRTEFPFMIRPDFPPEEDQLMVYRQLTNAMEDKEITIRTLDIGGDKLLTYYDHPAESNPEMGLRSIRFSLRHPEILREQIRAILRAGANCRRLRLMFPMISSADEFVSVREQVDQCLRELDAANIEHNPTPAVGVMVEIPSLIPIIDEMAAVTDFFCIGTNDFTQFMLAVDRANEKVASLYTPHHPAVLRSLHRIVEAARSHAKDVSVCGEMAHQVEYIPFLLGIGVRTLSLDPRWHPVIQKQIAALDLTEAESIARAVLRESSVRGVEQILGIAERKAAAAGR